MRFQSPGAEQQRGRDGRAVDLQPPQRLPTATSQGRAILRRTIVKPRTITLKGGACGAVTA